MTWLDLAAWLVGSSAALITLVFTIEVLLGALSSRNPAPSQTGPAGTTTILMPAHDEAAVIGGTLAALRPHLAPGVSVLVVADNCTDETAAIARSAGTDVIERFERDRRGKGFALAAGRDQLRESPPDCVIVLDADCEVEAGTLRQLADRALAADAPVQASYLLRPLAGASPMVELSTFAFAIKNEIRQRGLARLGVPAVLTGTGMAFPWRLFADAPLATDNLVEDLALGLDLLAKGERPIFLPGARVWSLPSGTSGTLQQRSRWEGGFLATARSRAVPLLLRGVGRLDWPLLWIGLHLLTPPLTLLVLADLGVIALLAGATVLGASPAPLWLLAGLLAAAAVALAAAWVRLGRAFLSLAAAIRLPLYFLWKLPLYGRLLLRRGPAEWTRTEREGERR